MLQLQPWKNYAASSDETAPILISFPTRRPGKQRPGGPQGHIQAATPPSVAWVATTYLVAASSPLDRAKKRHDQRYPAAADAQSHETEPKRHEARGTGEEARPRA